MWVVRMIASQMRRVNPHHPGLVQDRAHLGCQGLRPERLGEIADSLLQHSVLGDGVVRVPRREQHA